ncbi:hypothetical protein J6590_100764 [Homalodisca vitripennis]|nr:hypothetical protein J6590_100764 [Homalodisca vitripennis]
MPRSKEGKTREKINPRALENAPVLTSEVRGEGLNVPTRPIGVAPTPDPNSRVDCKGTSTQSGVSVSSVPGFPKLCYRNPSNLLP